MRYSLVLLAFFSPSVAFACVCIAAAAAITIAERRR